MEMKHVALLLLLVPFVGAAGEFAPIKADGLNAAMDNAVCKSQFMVGVLDSMVQNMNDSGNLSSDVSLLQSDVTALQGYSDSGDVEGFRTYMVGTFSPHMRQARLDILSQRGPGMGLQMRARLRSDYDSLRSTYDSCNADSLQRFGSAKLQAYEMAMDRAQSQIGNLSAKGLDTTGLSALKDGAESDVIDPLKSALDSATTGDEVRQALSQYCLFNGCPDGLNYHFAERFSQEKLQAILDFVKPTADENGVDVSDAQSELDSAYSILTSAGTSQYSSGQGSDIARHLNAAADGLKSAISTLRSG
jgi:hypothetical protein